MGNRCTLRWENAVVKSHGKKQRARQKSRRTGAAYASAAAGTTHEHTPLPDMAVLEKLPHAAGRELDLDLAARLVAACRGRCQPCQRTLAGKLRAEQRPTLAALAAAIYATLPSPGFVASPTTQEWARLARAGKTDAAVAAEALAAVETMDDAAASDLLEDALDHWAMGGASAEEIADMVTVVPEAPPRQQSANPMDACREAGIKVVTLDDLDLGDDVDTYHLQPNYGVYVGATNTPDGQDFPMLTLYPETEGAGIEDLERRTDWEHWGLHGMPDMGPRWRLRARIGDRSLQGLVHVDADGRDDIELWRASETVSMPDAWWDLLDRAQHVLIVGPTDPEALQDTADEGKLLAVVARVAFV
ncbi:hypothetical protein [Streptomyces sp. NPDC053813]|uniref:hypothetical protein n=1 Tax=Streptomyces sp. NPDC053813 TaxID=3365717 RepID=UPI0037D2018B